MDIKEFYPSITREILNDAISFPKEHSSITENELCIIKHCRKSLLFLEDLARKKKRITRVLRRHNGQYHDAEVCELVGLLILSKLYNLVEKLDAGLYRDNGLLFLRNANGRTTDITMKEIIRVFKSIGFQMEIATNLKSVNFFGVTLDLNIGTHCPNSKLNDTLLYVHTSCNHQQQILKKLLKSINDSNSSNKTIFKKSKLEYEEALRKSDYANPTLSFQPTKITSRKRNRPRNITWFNPPLNKNMTTNVAKTFLKLIDKHFPTASNLHKIFNRNTVKVSYNYTENVEEII